MKKITVDEQIVEDLKRHEGWRASAYRDSEGYLTIGWGFLIDERKRGRLPVPVAHYWLAYELDQIQDRLDAVLPWLDNAPDTIRRALVNMAYQLGVSGLLKFRKTLALLEIGKYQDAAEESLRSRWAEQTPNRAKEVAEWIASAGDSYNAC